MVRRYKTWRKAPAAVVGCSGSSLCWGLSLVEIIIGLSIFGLAMAMLISLIPTSSLGQQNTELRAIAGNLAQSTLEELSNKVSSVVTAPLATVTLEDGTVLQSRVEVKEDATPGLKIVRVVVSFTKSGVTREVFRELALTETNR